MNTAILEVLISVISSFLGVNLKDIKASLNKENAVFIGKDEGGTPKYAAL